MWSVVVQMIETHTENGRLEPLMFWWESRLGNSLLSEVVLQVSCWQRRPSDITRAYSNVLRECVVAAVLEGTSTRSGPSCDARACSSKKAPSRLNRRVLKWSGIFDPRRLVFLDEIWVRTKMPPLRGWNRKANGLKALRRPSYEFTWKAFATMPLT